MGAFASDADKLPVTYACLLQLVELVTALLASKVTLSQQHQADCLELTTRLAGDEAYPARRAAAHLLPNVAQIGSDQVHPLASRRSRSGPVWLLGSGENNVTCILAVQG